ncbi:hypothetical protein O0I10_000193 [Lichtheimia ornata]|uniref:Chromo domain-containing protein n=1 Tax=Lichtheimia ornata TaxID=688661 RepID=A0AAD8DJP3_9FUNG|nr:uncharacterized protein O0I10_000193 [Lichtheimia ornata]KAJ8663918.1 hypothetical protein O0I10_000193 [Lichtheimia ornata]
MADSPAIHEISSGDEYNSLSSGDEEEYEVERIVDHKRLTRGRYKYLIKWKGYSDEENTWESEDNIAAPELMDEYWRNHGDDADTARENKRKRVTTPDEDARAMPPPPPRTPRRTRQDDNQRQRLGRRTVKFNGHDVIVDDAYPQNADNIDWEKEVKAVELVGPQANGGLEAVIQWNDGKYSLHPCPLLHRKCPIKLLKYYENLLEFNVR